jgi:hypothetical protein
MPMRKRVLLSKDDHIEPHLTAMAVSVPRKCGGIAHLGDNSCHSPPLSSGMSRTFDMRVHQLLIEPSHSARFESTVGRIASRSPRYVDTIWSMLCTGISRVINTPPVNPPLLLT